MVLVHAFRDGPAWAAAPLVHTRGVIDTQIHRAFPDYRQRRPVPDLLQEQDGRHTSENGTQDVMIMHAHTVITHMHAYSYELTYLLIVCMLESLWRAHTQRHNIHECHVSCTG